MKKISTVILTCDRTPNYLQQTVESLQNGGLEFMLSQGSKAHGNLSSIDTNDVVVCPLPAIMDPDFEGKDVRVKATLNYINALTVGFTNNGTKGQYRLVLEDDVIACGQIRQLLAMVLDAVLWAADKKPEPLPYSELVTLYCALDTTDKQPMGVMLWQLDQFHGTQAMLYHEPFAYELSEYMKEQIGKEPYDFIIRDFCKKKGLPGMPTLTTSLFQHIGEVTTGLGYFHTSPNFIKNED